MSQEDSSENDVWDYKPLKKKKKRLSSSARSIARKPAGKAKAFTVKLADPEIETADNREPTAVDLADQHGDTDAQTDPSKSSKANGDEDAQDSSGDFCPMCQMPFSILVVQTQRWHIDECLDTPRDKCEGKYIYTTLIDSCGLESGNNYEFKTHFHKP